jgi:hypothetical protein
MTSSLNILRSVFQRRGSDVRLTLRAIISSSRTSWLEVALDLVCPEAVRTGRFGQFDDLRDFCR